LIPADLSERNYTFDNWKAMVMAMTKVRAAAEKAAVRPGGEAAQEIITLIEKLEKEVGFKFV
jgi:hypothetical protein